ncbi:MAG: helix-turn-helix domain-containing protein, partial [Bullifex sp.]
SPETGWIYSAFLPDDQNAFDKVSSISREFMITVLLITIVCLVMIMLTQELLYAPIQNLGNKVRTVLPEDEGTKNEFSGISKALDILSTKNNTLESALATNMTDIKNSRIYRLLNGAYQSTSDFNTDNIDLGLPLKYGSVTVLIALVKAQKSDLAEYCESEKRRLRELYLFYYCMEVAANDRIVFIINHENRYEPQALAEELMSHAKMSGMVFTIGIGSTTDDLSKVGQSYIEASGALDLRYVKGSGRIIRSSEISGIDASALYPKGEMTALSNALSADNIDSSLQAMDRIMALVQGGELPVYLVRCIVSDMFTLINRTFSVSDDTTPVSIQLSKADDIQDVMTIAEKWKGRLRDVMSSRQKSESSMKEIRQYIDDNCLRPDFSAYETADRFGMTLPNLSRLFKEYSGQNLIDYTTAIRMETAKDLLSSTGLSVSEIAEKVGYYNLSSFTRRFKQSTGISPTEFRSLNNITN